MVAVMEIEGDDGSRIELKIDDFKTVFGRGLGFNTKDRTVSRRHVLFKHEKNNNQTEPSVSFQVLGKNPLWVRVRKNGEEDEGEIKIFRKIENGEVGAGDWFCISSQSPVWFNIKRIGVAEDLESESLERNDLSKIDPVKEFGFLVIGHEFDCYPKERIKDVKNWNWFIQEPDQDDSDDDESLENKKKRKRVKKRGEKDDDDDDWSGESEEDKEIVGKLRKVERSKYSTRSKDKSKTKETAARKKHSLQKKTISLDNEEDDDYDDDEEDETLAGFIVNDDGDDEDQVRESDEEEELTDDDEQELDD